ncbi:MULTISPECIES: universal stress protein [unclassified Kitasatospora]|uniref:universal stress protein n=1 Tax=unclassified Kitasatospora TaxID=2633591 RepID=UPI0033FB5A89
MDTEVPPERRIVVGVDGSSPSKRALRWALGQAAATGAVVEAVICWRFPTVYGWAPASVDRELGAVAGRMLAQAVAEVTTDDNHVEIVEIVESGHAAEILLERARGAELLVVGNRGLGGLAGTLLGSVGQLCVQHAPCPVVVVRGDQA